MMNKTSYKIKANLNNGRICNEIGEPCVATYFFSEAQSIMAESGFHSISTQKQSKPVNPK
jgi:hypothetical protein